MLEMLVFFVFKIMISKQRKEARRRREWLDKKEADGFCTLCIRNLHPHEKTEACKITEKKFYEMSK